MRIFTVGLLLVLCLTVSVTAAAAEPSEGPPPAPACATGEALERLDKREAAENAYLEDLKTAPGITCAEPKIAALDQAAEKSRWTEVEEFFEPLTEGLTSVWIGAVLVLLAGRGLLWSLGRRRQTRRWRAVQRLLRPSVELEAFDAGWMDHNQGPQFESVFREAFQPPASQSPTVATGHAEIEEILKPLGEIDAAKTPVVIMSFLLALWPRLNYKVSGVLQAAGSHQQGVSIELTRGKHFVASTMLWGDKFHVGDSDADEKKAGESEATDPEAEIFREMAVAAAAWAEYELANDLGKTSELRTGKPLSWALFKAGLAWQRRGSSTKAALLYGEALDSDPTNAGALANLGFLLWMEGKNKEARSLFEKALVRYESGDGIPQQVNPDWYRVKFNLAGLHANLGTMAADGGRSEFATARTIAEELIVLGLRETLRLPEKNVSEEGIKVIDEIVSSSLAVFAATGVPATVGPEVPALTSEELLGKAERQQLNAAEAMRFLTGRTDLSMAVSYNVASAQAVRREERAAVATLEAALARVDRATKARVATEAFADPTFKPVWAGAEGEAFEDRLRAAAGMPPLNCFRKQLRKMGCLGRH